MSSEIRQRIERLTESRKSLLIASLNQDNIPEISATPFLKVGLSFYIFISELATHTQNISLKPTLSIMLIEDEQDTKNAFARKRLSYGCTALKIERSHPNWHSLLDEFEAQQGKTIGLLKQLADFHLFELKANSGNYIEGFGQAYRLTGKDLETVELQTKS